MKMAIIGHAHVLKRNRIDFEYLNEEFDLQFIYPKKWKGSLSEIIINEQGFKKLSIPFIKNAYIPFLPALEDIDILWIDEEPVSPQTYFILKHFNKIPLKIIRMAQNIEKRDIYRNFMYDYVNKNIDEICVIGELAGQNARRIFNKDIHIVYHAIPSEFFIDRSINMNRKLNIGIAGRLDKSKGIEYVFEIIKELKDKVRFIIAGTGAEQNRLLHILKKTEADFEYRGYIEHLKMVDFYKDIDIFVNTSITLLNWKEQYGRSITEALAAGITVISFNCGEIPFILKDYGMLVKEGDYKTIVEYILNIDKNRQMLETYKEKALKRANDFNFMSIGRSVYEIIKKHKQSIT